MRHDVDLAFVDRGDPAIATFVAEARERAERAVANEIAQLVHAKPNAVLGLPTGNTPVGVYRELARMHREEGVDLSRTVTFNLDEYVGLGADHPASFARAMRALLFDAVNVSNSHAHIPDGSVVAERLDDHCRAYERAIRAAGGIDLLLLGIGRNGHIAFNEPGSTRDSRTRIVELHATTRADAAAAFGGLEHVPERAITMGVATILEARRICVLAFGSAKAACVRDMLHGAVGPGNPATFLRGHSNARLWLDAAAARGLDGAG